MVKVKVPATSANLGPGFDCLGMALNIYNELSFEIKGETLKITGCDTKYQNAENPAVKGFFEALKHKNIELPKGLCVNIKSDIPISRGLGSSAALTVAGVLGANSLYALRLSKEEQLLAATKVEGHPDNAAPCIFGNLTASVIEGGQAVVAKYKVDSNIKLFVLIPDFEVSTASARAILPADYSGADAVFTMGRLGILPKALETGDPVLLRSALQDKIHEPYRKTLIPKYDELRELAMSLGSYGTVISGSGSTILVVGGKDNTKDALVSGLKKIYEDVTVNGKPVCWTVREVRVDEKGALAEVSD